MVFCSFRSYAAAVFVPILLALLYKQVYKDLPKYKLAIGILSARENFSQRSAIRSTWLSVLNKTEVLKDVLVKFVLANENCEIPVTDRKGKYSCEEIRPFTPDSFEVWDILSLVRRSSKVEFDAFPSEYAIVAFDFTVIFDVVISGISTPLPNENAILQLWDLASEILVVESLPQKHAIDSQWDVRNIESYLLPKGFVGSIVVHCLGESGCVGVKNWFDPILFPPAIEISPFLRYSRQKNEFPINILPIPLDLLALPALFRFEIADSENITKFLKSKHSRLEKHHKDLLIIDKELNEEINHYQDILILPDNGGGLVEVYHNLPNKVVKFHEWCDSNVNFDYIMKTDDDSYVDIEALIKILDHIQSTKPIWFGNFRRDWIVDRYGKWAEYDYTASVYPAYACGAGYVISKDLSKYLAQNSNKLKYYQGEDVSMGIWMSALDVNYVQDDRVICDDGCSEDMLVTTQRSSTDLKRLWRNKVNCGNLCSCS